MPDALDTTFLARAHSNRWVFQCGSGSEWQAWDKPPSARFVSLICIGAGAGGGGGGSITSGGGDGGGGGGSGAIATLWIDAELLPDRLYIKVNPGGAGGAGNSGGGVTGSSGGQVVIGAYPNTAVTGLILSASHTNAGGGGGAVVGNGTAGAAATVSTVGTDQSWASGGIFIAIAGSAGATGNAGLNYPGNGLVLVSGGAGGGSAGSGGGSIIGQGLLLAFPTLVPGGTSGGAGAGGIALSKCDYGLMYTGGAGGGSVGASGTGGNGGNGSFGCGGGGGGGAGSSATAPGNGGNGGNGLVIIKVM